MKTRTLLVNVLVGILTFAVGVALPGIFQRIAPDQIRPQLMQVEAVKPIHSRIFRRSQNSVGSDDSANLYKNVGDAIAASTDRTTSIEKTYDSQLPFNRSIEGFYEIVGQPVFGAGKQPMQIWLGQYNEDLGKWVEGPPTGFIKRNKTKFKFEKIHYARGKISIVTEEKKGIHYEFRGEYSLKKIKEDGVEFEDNVLSGRLSKYKNEKLQNLEEIEFTWAEIGC